MATPTASRYSPRVSLTNGSRPSFDSRTNWRLPLVPKTASDAGNRPRNGWPDRSTAFANSSVNPSWTGLGSVKYERSGVSIASADRPNAPLTMTFQV